MPRRRDVLSASYAVVMNAASHTCLARERATISPMMAPRYGRHTLRRALCSCALSTLLACVGDDTGQPDAGKPDATAANDASLDVTTSDVADADAGPQRYCATQSPPDGAADFTCADFDGTNLGEGFTDASVTSGASLAANNLAFVSSPNSLLAQTPGDPTNPLDAYYFWRQPGGKRVHTVTLTMAVNPFPTGQVPPQIGGEIYLATMPTSVGYIAFGYTRNNSNTTALSGYTGYFVESYRSSPPPSASFTKVAPLTENIWTEVAMTLDEEGLTLGLTYDGASQVTGGTIQFSATETVAQAVVGTQTIGQTPIYAFRYDNVRISTTRDP